MKSGLKKIFFIVNKFAGAGYQPQLEGRIISQCASQDVECTIEFTQHEGHAITLAKEASLAGYPCVVAVGGDGTINEVAQGLINTSTPMGIIPRGSGNGLARHLGIGISVQSALNSLFNSEVLMMDTFTLNGKLSLNVSGIGFDGQVANLFQGRKSRGLSGYTRLALQEFFQFKEFDAVVYHEKNQTEYKAFVIAIANASQYGNNARIAPAASVRDELLHVNVMRKVPAYRLDFIYSFFTGSVASSGYCKIIETKSLSVKTNRLIPYHVDGEPGGLTDTFDVTLSPSSLQMMVPMQLPGKKRVL